MLLLGVPVVGFLLPQASGMRRGLDPGGMLFWASVAHGALVTLVIWVGLRDWGRRRHLFSVGASRPRFGWAGYVTMSAAAGFGCAYAGTWLWYQLSGVPVDLLACLRCGWISLILSCVLTQFYLALYVRADLRFASARAAELRDRATRIRLQSSTCRREPEAVLDALAVLRSLVQSSPAAAVNHAQSVALVYRYVLRESTRELVILRDELALLARHAELLAARRGRALHMDTRIAPEHVDRFLIVPVTLHTLLEIAVPAIRPVEGGPAGALHVTLEVEGSHLRFAFGPAHEFAVADSDAYRAVDARVLAVVGARCAVAHRAGITSVSVPLLPITH